MSILKRIKKPFNTGSLYAGPDPETRKPPKEYKTEDVYAGPVQYEAPQNNFGTVYAAPDVLESLRVKNDSKNHNLMNTPPYPFNNASNAEKNVPEINTVECPCCGEQTRNHKFCEMCGYKL